MLAILFSNNCLAHESDVIYDDSQILEFHITFAIDDWYSTLWQNYLEGFESGEQEYTSATFTFNGENYENVGVRIKGYTSTMHPNRKKPFKIKFNEFNENQEFYGVDKINLNNAFADPTFLREKILYDSFNHFIPSSRSNFVKLFVKKSKEIGIGKIATITGRYYSMDRDNRWDRVEKGYDALVKGKGEYYNDEVSTVQDSYNKDITDEFILPKILIENGKPRAIIKENDAVIAFNFRADRMRELTRSFVMPDFEEFKATKFKNLKYVCFNEYDVDFNPFTKVAFRLPKLTQILGEVISEKGIKQLRLAETEKYAHVTFFFNGGVEKPFENEERILVPSPKVATYDLQPEMSAIEVKDKLISALKAGEYPFIVTNFANCDMVGHTGFFDKAVKAVETVDKCVGEVIAEATKQKYNIILTADHGNADVMTDENGNTFTAHSMNPVEVVISLNSDNKIVILDGKLADIAPTVLKIMNIPIPKEMTGNVLII